MDAAAVMNQFGAKRFCEALNGVFRRTVRGLQWNRPVGQRRSNLHDDAAIARDHTTQCGQCPVHISQVGDLGDPAILSRCHLKRRREDRHHRVIDPDVDGPQFPLDSFRRRLHLTVIRNIRDHGQSAAAEAFHILSRAGQSVAASREQTDGGSMPGELAGDGPSDAGRGAGDHDDFSRSPSVSAVLGVHRLVRREVPHFAAPMVAS